MKTLLIAALALPVLAYLAWTLAPFPGSDAVTVLTTLVAFGVVVWVGLIYSTAWRADAVTRRRRDAEFARRHRVVR